jgi:predicted GNAT superfamily acetyltransferase
MGWSGPRVLRLRARMIGFHSFNGLGGTALRVQVRRAKSWEEFRECERIQQEVWGTLAASSELLSVTQKCGGVVLGVFLDKKMAGFLYAFLGRFEKRTVHWSHMMAVRQRCRDLGLGFRMKVAHRRLALAQGIKSIYWTYDPLQSRNAYLNIRRLGASVEGYIVDCYGRFPSAIEKGLPSDRLVANWRISSAAVEHRLKESALRQDYAGLPWANETRPNSLGFIENERIHLDLRGPQLLVAIPANTERMRADNPPLALRWRLETRRIFQHYFRAGFRIVDFVPPVSPAGQNCFYFFKK